MRDVNIKSDTLNLIEEKMDNCQNMGIGNNIQNRTIAQALRTTFSKWDFMKLRSFIKT